jgi:hypothetical protein
MEKTNVLPMCILHAGCAPEAGYEMTRADESVEIGEAAGLDVLVRQRPFARLRADVERLRRAVALSTCLVAAWSMFEVPWELDLNSSREQTAAVFASKTLLLIITGLSLLGRRWARYLLLFICLTSVLAIAPELPSEFVHSPWLAFLSSVECFTKLAAVVLLAMHLRLASKLS